MKLTKAHLKQIINEELAKILSEQEDALSKLTGGKSEKGLGRLAALSKDVDELSGHVDSAGGDELTAIGGETEELGIKDTQDHLKFETIVQEEHAQLLNELGRRKAAEAAFEKDPTRRWYRGYENPALKAPRQEVAPLPDTSRRGRSKLAQSYDHLYAEPDTSGAEEAVANYVAKRINNRSADKYNKRTGLDIDADLVRDFQRNHGLTPDGKLGPKTQAKFKKLYPGETLSGPAFAREKATNESFRRVDLNQITQEEYQKLIEEVSDDIKHAAAVPE